jgi:hypothetical protein
LPNNLWIFWSEPYLPGRGPELNQSPVFLQNRRTREYPLPQPSIKETDGSCNAGGQLKFSRQRPHVMGLQACPGAIRSYRFGGRSSPNRSRRTLPGSRFCRSETLCFVLRYSCSSKVGHRHSTVSSIWLRCVVSGSSTSDAGWCGMIKYLANLVVHLLVKRPIVDLGKRAA